jgi:hypothetical protein
MADFGFTPELVASGTINPFRMVELSGAFQGSQANAASDNIVGVTDGSVKSGVPGNTGNSVHAEAGDQISLQPSNTVQIEAAAAISAGALVTSNASGLAITGTANQVCYYIALEAATAANEIIRCFRIGTRVVP